MCFCVVFHLFRGNIFENESFSLILHSEKASPSRKRRGGALQRKEYINNQT